MADGFLSRWSRLKTEAREAPRPEALPAAVPVPAPVDAAATRELGNASDAPAEPAAPLPTIDDAMRLGPDSDYSAFVARGVDARVRRQALRKLFSDPHFHTVDGLDVYMGDYTKSDPMAPAMLASLRHAGAWLRRQVEGEVDQAPGTQGARLTANEQQDHRQDRLPDHHKATAPQAPAREHDEH